MKNSDKGKTLSIETADLSQQKISKSKNERFPVVGLGASAGGLEALEEFFENMPKDSGMAFVIIQHLGTNPKSIMPELLQRTTEMEVVVVTDRLEIKPNCIYVIPQNKSMSILNGSLYLFEPIETHGLRLPIDFFFSSLADDVKELSIGIIFSGMGADGSLGAKVIKEKGGIILVQDPESAKFDSMPQSAIQSVNADGIAHANQLPAKLLRVIESSYRTVAPAELIKDESSLDKIIILLRSQTGNDFSQYKKNTLYRRIERRMGIHKISKIDAYVRFLQDNPTELEILFNELLIGVTNFFRDTVVWEHLKNKIFPALFANLQQRHVLRAWVPACSTGEEAYTLAIIFKEAIEKAKLDKNVSLQIFATDLDNGAIEQARKGVFQDSSVTDVSASRLSRFFVKIDNHYRVNAEIREMVVFACQNVIKDPPFTKLDIVSCRNMLIYLDSDLQKKIMSLFHYSLNLKGILVLGSAETSGDSKDLFTTLDSKLHIYQSKGKHKTEELFNFPSSFAKHIKSCKENHVMTKIPDNIQSLSDNLLLQQFSPASTLVTSDGDILYLTGDTGKYLTLAAGKASMNIFTMAREGLQIELPIAFRKATKNYDKLILHNLKIGSNQETVFVDVTIQQIEKPLALKGKIMVVFNDVPVKIQKSSRLKKTLESTAVLQTEFEQELQRLNEELQTTREEMQTSHEELKSTNEELQSSNEEMQSTNEELTTSKEEMQSLNEELSTLNVELQSKINDSERITNDINNLLNSSEIATLFLDKELKISQFTNHSTKIFKLIQSDIGRHYTDLANNLIYPEMLNDAKEVLKTLVFVEKTISSTEGLYYTIRIMPYRTIDDKIEGLVITFIDITVSKNIEHALLETQSILKSLIFKVPGVVIALSSIGKIIEFNPEAEKVFGRKRNEVIDENYFDLFIPAPLRAKVKSEMNQILSNKLPNQFENQVKSATGSQLNIEWTARKLFDEKGILTGIIAIGENITKL